MMEMTLGLLLRGYAGAESSDRRSGEWSAGAYLRDILTERDADVDPTL